MQLTYLHTNSIPWAVFVIAMLFSTVTMALKVETLVHETPSA